MDKLPQISTLYRALDRFKSKKDTSCLWQVNRALLGSLVNEFVILDLDSTVNTVHGAQEGSCVSYNPRYRGRKSYQPLAAFDGNSQATVTVELRSGHSPDAQDIIGFYKEAADVRPVHSVRADRGFASEKFFVTLEADEVDYTIKMPVKAALYNRIALGVLWERIYFDNDTVIEVGAVPFKYKSWTKSRRVVLIRTRPIYDDPQEKLFEEYVWDYQAIVTTLDWDPESVWHFYNQRCTCENYIKELKYGVNADAISMGSIWPNAADLWLKAIAYNVLLILKSMAPEEYQKLSISRIQRSFLRVPGVLVRHARKYLVRLPTDWPHRRAWEFIRLCLA